ncbi:CLUMA_CG013321, isoform A [Clunio marinus]|uniref:CLUMA_CG013321, isoform A n=1 Tax=Clunio marinus TaxID=568069 RepID=A0A1J1INI1_9DIPT|nr:CLUMA_CG013321, isoform A [Clunio marinus]
MGLFKLFILLQSAHLLISIPYQRFTKIECQSSQISVSKFRCFLKSYKRNNPLLNVEYTLTRKVDKSKVDLRVQRYSSSEDNYNKIMGFENVELCKLLKGSTNISFLKEYIENLKRFNGNVVSSCDRIGDFHISNVSYSGMNYLRLFPAGKYKNNLHFHDSDDSNIFNLTYVSIIFHK